MLVIFMNLFLRLEVFHSLFAFPFLVNQTKFGRRVQKTPNKVGAVFKEEGLRLEIFNLLQSDLLQMRVIFPLS